MKRGVGILSVVALVLLASGCSKPSLGPLELGGDLSTLCISASEEERVAYGDLIKLPEDAPGTVVLDQFSMEGVTPDEVQILPIEQTGMQGSFRLDDPPEVWESRVPAEGYEVTPGSAENIVVVFPARGTEGIEAEPLHLEYHVGDKQYFADATVTVQVKEALRS